MPALTAGPFASATSGAIAVCTLFATGISKQLLNVGESHAGLLYKTVTRHFQAWNGKTSGPTYRRSTIEIAVHLTPPPAAVLGPKTDSSNGSGRATTRRDCQPRTI